SSNSTPLTHARPLTPSAIVVPTLCSPGRGGSVAPNYLSLRLNLGYLLSSPLERGSPCPVRGGSCIVGHAGPFIYFCSRQPQEIVGCGSSMRSSDCPARLVDGALYLVRLSIPVSDHDCGRIPVSPRDCHRCPVVRWS